MSRHLIAKMTSGRRVTAGWADWKSDDSVPSFPLDSATLENGHRLSVGQSFLTPGSWGYTIYGAPTEDNEWPQIAESPVINKDTHPNYPNAWKHEMLTREQARDAAEKHYEKLFPIGTDTGSHDSGVDYSDLNKFMGEL